MSGDFPVQQEGRFTVADTRIAFSPFCDTAYTADFELSGDQLSLTVADAFGDTTTFLYRLEPGSPAGVVQEIAAVDDEVTVVDTDEGEQLSLELVLGRRQVTQNGLCFEEIEWVTEQLEEGTRRLQEGN